MGALPQAFGLPEYKALSYFARSCGLRPCAENYDVLKINIHVRDIVQNSRGRGSLRE